MLYDPVFLARLQFAFTVGFHILMPTLTIGLSWYLVYCEYQWHKTKNLIYLQQYKFWVLVFALAFGLGVVTGVVLAYQFGTNFAGFIHKVGNVLGPLLAYEVLTAFFLESGFLGIMLFGWNKVGPKLHFFSTFMVAIGTVISAFWILSANSWMQTPQGFRVDDQGIFFSTNWLEVIFNPSFTYRFPHMITASLVTASFFIAGIASYYLIKGEHIRFAQNALSFMLKVIIIIVPFQIILGDMHGLNTLEHQPAKVAAMEGLWETKAGADLILFAIPDQVRETNEFEIAIPQLSGLILKHNLTDPVLGLKAFDINNRPPVKPVFYSFRIMVAIGFLMLFMGIWGIILKKQNRLFSPGLFHKIMVVMTPFGFMATISGWFVTEIGRQPYLVQNALKTGDSISPVPSINIATSLGTFIFVYGVLLIAFIYYLFKLIAKGPDPLESKDYHEPETSFGYHDIVGDVLQEPKK